MADYSNKHSKVKSRVLQKEVRNRVSNYFVDNRINRLPSKQLQNKINFVDKRMLNASFLIQREPNYDNIDFVQLREWRTCITERRVFILRLRSIIDNMCVSTNIIEKNTGQWLKSRSANPTLCVVTKTHDSDKRVESNGTLNQVALFPLPIVNSHYNLDSQYDASYDIADINDPNVIYKPDYEGWQNGNIIVIRSDKYRVGENEIKECLIHELQHYADKNEGVEYHKNKQSLATQDERKYYETFRIFRTEFNAYYASNNKSEEKVKRVVFDQFQDTKIYYNDPTILISGKTFKYYVDDYVNNCKHRVIPVYDEREVRGVYGFNGVNSMRIDELYEIFNDIETTRTVESSVLLDGLNHLDSMDKSFISYTKFWRIKYNNIVNVLKDDMLILFKNIMKANGPKLLRINAS